MKTTLILTALIGLASSVQADPLHLDAPSKQSKYDTLKEAYDTSTGAATLAMFKSAEHKCVAANRDNPDKLVEVDVHVYKITIPGKPGTPGNGPLFPGTPSTPDTEKELLALLSRRHETNDTAWALKQGLTNEQTANAYLVRMNFSDIGNAEVSFRTKENYAPFKVTKIVNGQSESTAIYQGYCYRPE